MSLLDKASLISTPNGFKASKLYSIVPSSGAGDLDVVRATTATRVNSAGLIESVATNVPRIDYTNGSCPSLLVEPQRTNLLTYSEQFNDASWIKTNATITANSNISPSGTQDADTLVLSSGGSILKSVLLFQATSGQSITASVFVKTSSTNFVIFGGATPAGNDVYTIEAYPNGWYRHKITRTFTVTIIGTIQYFIFNATVGTYFIWGAQLEAGAYATSYVPTVATSVTRNADVISKTGISSLIGQTEGTMFIDLYASAKNKDGGSFATWLIAGDATNNFQIYNLSGDLYWFARNTAGGIFLDQLANQTIVAGTRYKIAIAYKSGDYALYINGVQKRTNTNTNIPTVSQFNLSSEGFGSSPAIVKNEYNSVQFYKTRLTNAELASLTTI